MEIVFHKQFLKRFRKVPVKIQEQFYSRLTIFEKDKTSPILNNHSVNKAFQSCRSINITGDYRAIYYDNGPAVVFLTLGTHSELYR